MRTLAFTPLFVAGCAAQVATGPALIDRSTWVRSPMPASSELRVRSGAATRELRLPNGLRVVVVEHHRRPIVVASLLFPRGAAHEPAKTAGSTFLAIALLGDFRETDEDGKRLVDEHSLRRQVAEAGGTYRSMVSSDYSGLEIRGFSKDAPTYLQLLASAVLNPRHGIASFAGRRGAMMDVAEDVESTEGDVFEELLIQRSFGERHPYSAPTYGTMQSLEELMLDDVIEHQRRVLTPEGTTLLVVGDVNAAQTIGAITTAFGKWSGKVPKLSPIPPPEVPKKESVGFIERSPSTTLSVCASRPLSDVGSKDVALEVLAAAVGGVSGPLSRTLREEHGLTYDANAAILRRRYAQAFVACTRLRADAGGKGLQLMRDQFEELRRSGPSAEAIRRAKATLRAEALQADDTVQRSLPRWQSIVVGAASDLSSSARLEAIERVSPEELRALSAQVFDPSTIRWLLSGERSRAVQAVEAAELGTLKALRIQR